MENRTIENRLHLDNADPEARIHRTAGSAKHALQLSEVHGHEIRLVISRLGILDPGVYFIEKPFSVESLAGKVNEVLAKRSYMTKG
ncbi:MAG: hypothetical protein M0T82_00040 [Desulfobacteraceae bacterium]|nr:hypothetical protein [Desulfobacteraceae bacterium]